MSTVVDGVRYGVARGMGDQSVLRREASHFRNRRACAPNAKKTRKSQAGGYGSEDDAYLNLKTEVVLISSDARDAWRLDDVAKYIQDGAVRCCLWHLMAVAAMR